MGRLQELDASSNMLTSVSPTLAELPSLAVLDISGNDIQRLPDSLAQSSSLIMLDACRNPLVRVPAGLVRHREVSHSIPVEVAPGLFVGAADAAANRTALRHFGITHMMALGPVTASEWPDASVLIHPSPDSATLLDKEVREEAGVDFLARLPRYLAFLHAASQRGVQHGQPVHLVEDTPKFYQDACQASPRGKGRRGNQGVGQVLNEVVSTIDAPTTRDCNGTAKVTLPPPPERDNAGKRERERPHAPLDRIKYRLSLSRLSHPPSLPPFLSRC